MQVQTREPDWAKMGGASQEVHHLCRKMLIKKLSHRPSAQDALKERWFRVMEAGQKKKGLDKRQLDALLKVADRGVFEKFITRLVATQVDASRFQEVSEAFMAFDTDKDGEVSKEELRQG